MRAEKGVFASMGRTGVCHAAKTATASLLYLPLKQPFGLLTPVSPHHYLRLFLVQFGLHYRPVGSAKRPSCVSVFLSPPRLASFVTSSRRHARQA